MAVGVLVLGIGIGVLVGGGEQRVLLYWCLKCGQWVIFMASFLFFAKTRSLDKS